MPDWIAFHDSVITAPAECGELLAQVRHRLQPVTDQHIDISASGVRVDALGEAMFVEVLPDEMRFDLPTPSYGTSSA